MHAQPRDSSASAILSAARARGLVEGELNMIPELESIFRQGERHLYNAVVNAMDFAKGRRVPEFGMTVMQNACKYLFIKGVEAVILWGQTGDGKISLGIDPREIVDLEVVTTDLSPEHHEMALASMQFAAPLFYAHHHFVLARLDVIPELEHEDFIRREMAEALEWVSRVAISFALKRHSRPFG
jgi:hypothetical protein